MIIQPVLNVQAKKTKALPECPFIWLFKISSGNDTYGCCRISLNCLNVDMHIINCDSFHSL